MKRLASLLFATALALGSLFAGSSTALASFAACNTDYPSVYDNVGSGTNWVRLYETQDYNTGQQPPWLGQLCVNSTTLARNVPDLKAIIYTNDYDSVHICDGQLASSYGTWNDCVGSIKVSIDCHHAFAAWDNANYTGNLIASYSVSGQNSFGFGPNDTMSSFKLTYNPVCQSAPVGAPAG